MKKIFSVLLVLLVVFGCSLNCFALDAANIELVNGVLYVGLPDGVLMKNDSSNCPKFVVHDGGIIHIDHVSALFARIVDGWGCDINFGGYTSADEINVVKLDDFFADLRLKSEYYSVEPLLLAFEKLAYTAFDVDNVGTVEKNKRMEIRFGFSSEGIEQLYLLKEYFDKYFHDSLGNRYGKESLEPFNEIKKASSFDVNPDSYSLVIVNDFSLSFFDSLTDDSFYIQRYYDFLSTPEESFDLVSDLISILDVSQLVGWLPPVVATTFISSFAFLFAIAGFIWVMKFVRG